MKHWLIVLIFLLVLPFTAYAQNVQDKAMELWVGNTLGIQIPHPEIGQSWKSLPMISACNFEWHVGLDDSMIQVKDGYDNYYRLSYQGNTVTLDFIRAFNGLIWG